MHRVQPCIRGQLSARNCCTARANGQVDFCWETTCERLWERAHAAATVRSRLHFSQVLEDKANFAYLQQLLGRHGLESYVAKGRNEVRRWAERRWKSAGSEAAADDWWVVKSASVSWACGLGLLLGGKRRELNAGHLTYARQTEAPTSGSSIATTRMSCCSS